MAATIQMNSTISVDCVVFGFDGTALKVLLVRRKYAMDDISADDLKLPGEMIRENETLDAAASIDNRNFRKKVLSSGFVIPTDKKETRVAHKPARYYEFNRTAYNKAIKGRNPLKFLANWAY